MSKISGLLGLKRLTHTRGVVLPTAIHCRTLGSHTLGSSLDLSQSLVPPNTAQACGPGCWVYRSAPFGGFVKWGYP